MQDIDVALPIATAINSAGIDHSTYSESSIATTTKGHAHWASR